MIIECNVKTITEVDENKITISCISLNNQESGKDEPTLFKADLLENVKTINKVNGIEGELLLTHNDSNDQIGKLDENGNLILSLDDDDADNYYVNSNGELVYGQ